MTTQLDDGVEVSCLSNGMRVVTHQMPHLQSATLGIWVGSGSRHETAKLQGISHLLEHMAFKATLNRSARQMAEEIEAVGGEINAATSHETTAYFARVLKPDTGLALDLLADMLLNPRFDEAELERERGVILQEIAAANDQPEDLVYEQAEEASYTGQPLGRPILGTRTSVGRISAADLRRHIGHHYTASRMVLGAAGAVDHGALVRHAEALFGRFNGGESRAAEPARFSGGVRFANKPFEQHHVLMAFEGPSYLDPAYFSAQVLSGLLGGGASSRLFQKVREDHGLCYAIEAFGWGYCDTGVIGVHAATGSDMVGDLTDMVAEEIRDIASHGPTLPELERAKAQMRAGLLMSLESSGARAEQLARHVMVHGRPLTTDELVVSVADVTANAVRELAARVFSAPNPVWSEVGPGANGEHASRLVRLLTV